MELDSLLPVLSSSDLVTTQEIQVFRSVERWLLAKREQMEKDGEENIGLHMERLTVSCMEHVRFPMMTPAQLADLLLSPLISSHMEPMVQRMASAMAYHRDTENSILNLLKYKNGDRLLTPRLYTEDKYCASLSVDYFLQVIQNSNVTHYQGAK